MGILITYYELDSHVPFSMPSGVNKVSHHPLSTFHFMTYCVTYPQLFNTIFTAIIIIRNRCEATKLSPRLTTMIACLGRYLRSSYLDSSHCHYHISIHCCSHSFRRLSVHSHSTPSLVVHFIRTLDEIKEFHFPGKRLRSSLRGH